MEARKSYKLYSLAEWINGMAFRDINFSSKGLPVIKIAEIKSGISGQTKFTGSTYDSKYLVKKGDMLFCWSGQPETSIGTFWWQKEDGWLNQHIFKVLPNEKVVTKDFFFYILQNLKPHFVEIARNKQTTGLGHVTKKDLERIDVSIPPFKEQKAIAKILSALDDKIELNRRMNETLEAIARALFKAWFTDFEPVRANMENRPSESASPEIAKLFPSEFENGIPTGWEVKELNKIFEVNPLRSLQKGKNAKYLDMANVPISGHRVSGWINRVFSSGTKFKKGDTLLARITPCLENGKTGFVDFLDDEEIGWGSTEFIVLRPQNGLPNYFAYLLCRNDDFRNFAIQSMTGTSGRQRVQVDSLGKYLLSVPPKDSLINEKFGLVLNPMVEKIKQNSEETVCLAQTRDSLLPRLISGKIPVSAIEHKAKGENE